MNKIYVKLIAIILTLALSISVVVMSTYAWFVLSGNPAATGIQVAIAGGNTILVAPDVTAVVDGVTYHYPGHFSGSMQVDQQESYRYLQDVGGLTPVSTADGVHWFLPAYYDYSDPEVREGTVLNGQLKDVSQFSLDDELSYANLPAEETQKIAEGNYLYLDFWVVAPGGDFTLRVSAGDEKGGSFLVDLQQPVEAENVTGYALEELQTYGSSAVRVGFLANEAALVDDTMLHYQNSLFFDERYTKLQGLYQEPDSGNANLSMNRFTIYEPNCDLDYTGNVGGYSVTYPVGLEGNQPAAVSVAGKVTAQKTSTWISAEQGSGTAISQRFQAAVLDMDTQQMEPEQISRQFYETYLQYQVSPYIEKGVFIQKSEDLFKFGDGLSSEQLSQLDTQGATEDVYIVRLERNVPQRIRMFIWLEGQDKDCVNVISTSSFMLNLELAGATD